MMIQSYLFKEDAADKAMPPLILGHLSQDAIEAKLGEGSLFFLNKHYCFSAREYDELEELSETDRTLLKDIYLACLNSTNGLASLGDLQRLLDRCGRSKGKSMIFRQLRGLTANGLIQTQDYKPAKRRGVTIYRLKHPSRSRIAAPATTLIDHKPYKKELNHQISRLQTEYNMLTDANPSRLRSESLMSGILDRCLRINHHDKSRILRSELRINGETITVVTTCQTDSEIAMISDQRIVWAIYSLIEQTIRQLEGCPIRNEFVLDIKEICRMMGLDASGGNREYVRKAIDRLYKTNFEITCHQPDGWFAQRFGFGMTTHNFRFLMSLSSSVDESTLFVEDGVAISTRKPRFVLVSLHPRIFDSLFSGQENFQVNPLMMKEQIGLAHAIYNICKIVVGVSAKKNVPLRMSLPQFHNYLLPSCQSYQRFRNEFDKLMTKYQVPDHPTDSRCALLCGYYLILSEERGVPQITITRDRNDPYVGDQSHYNRRVGLA